MPHFPSRGICLILILTLLSCASKPAPRVSAHHPRPAAPAPSADPLPPSMPYEVDGVIYYPLKTSRGYAEEGQASWYGPQFHRKATSNKESYDMESMTAAHKTLPFNTMVRVTNLENGRTAVVRINDRGPFVKERVIDLSHGAAQSLGMAEKGTAHVRLVALNEVVVEDMGGDPGSRYTVQIAVFGNSANAEKLQRSLESSRVSPVAIDEKKFYRVLFGSYNDFSEAVRSRDSLRRQGHKNAFIIQETEQP